MSQPTIEEFTAEASTWLTEHATPRQDRGDQEPVWGEGDFRVSVFHALSHDDERQLLDDLKSWSHIKAERGYHAISAPRPYGGLGLPPAYARAFARLEAGYVTPRRHELFNVTTRLIAPTVDVYGTDEQKERFVEAFYRPEQLCCQLFSEPGAGSDLASLACRAERDGDQWRINGQKVWSSGAQFAGWGELIARSDPGEAKHAGMTAFLVPMDTPGVEVRPIKQMSGGMSFNEVFFDDVRLPDTARLGPVGEGWQVALTTLGFERDHSGSGGGGRARAGGTWPQLVATARHHGQTDDPIIRQRLMEVYIHSQVQSMVNQRAADTRAAGSPPGPEGSIGKLMWTQGLTLMSQVVGEVLGPRLVADTGMWGTFAWTEHVLGAPGYRIAGGSDEIQRNILGERVLGLPREPRVDKGIPWRDVPR